MYHILWEPLTNFLSIAAKRVDAEFLYIPIPGSNCYGNIMASHILSCMSSEFLSLAEPYNEGKCISQISLCDVEEILGHGCDAEFTTDNPIKFLTGGANPKICMEQQKTPNSQCNLEKKNKVEGIILSNSKLYYKVIVNKTVWY